MSARFKLGVALTSSRPVTLVPALALSPTLTLALAAVAATPPRTRTLLH